jgi:Ser/Thr protein kinase RdoA (MazF antagonist)
MPVAAVVPNRHGRYVTEVDGLPGVPGRQRCVLFHWLPGSHPDDRAQHYWYRLGHLAARLHQQAAGLDLPSWATPRRWDSVFPYEPNLLADERHGGVLEPSQRQVVERAIDALDPVMAERYRSPDRRPRLLHGDLHDENVLVCRGRLSVFDFEDLILGHPEHDLAVALYGPYYNRSDFDDVVATMRAGYEEVAPWPIEALDGLRPLFAARALGLANYCVSLGGHYLDYVAMLVERVEAYLDNPTDAAGATHDRPANDPAPAR